MDRSVGLMEHSLERKRDEKSHIYKRYHARTKRELLEVFSDRALFHVREIPVTEAINYLIFVYFM